MFGQGESLCRCLAWPHAAQVVPSRICLATNKKQLTSPNNKPVSVLSTFHIYATELQKAGWVSGFLQLFLLHDAPS